MAVINRNTLVLNNVSVIRGVVTRTPGMGFDTASCKTASIPFSMRPLSHPYPRAGQRTSRWQSHADPFSAAPAADRAGRPERLGALASRSSAPSLATGGSCPTAAWGFGRFTARHLASVGNVLPERLLASRAEPPAIGKPAKLPYEPRAKSHVEAGPVGVKPIAEALRMSARGSGF
jgi:hypothetical protein